VRCKISRKILARNGDTEGKKEEANENDVHERRVMDKE
jgi:hypothetical protein